ncbi:metallophosphoesterase family protein [Methanobrevibacter filiformis]|uniref:3',5'-cyclic adenosine monophosphate phosphodiesterase CpdA n=1 Tax=Methanobrevibacter filiformis TaxID=55758 RepID=A0A166DA30_9EURY|nr:metallophosphoesterase [Methanobrevibacter filiformis]KZX15363.1 3',5'-cyclic adenosine monophosphate phosphodiesterase CpdA [Methanobrevibacter filiformis]
MTFIAHISDLHVGTKGFNKDSLLYIVDEINSLKPDLIVLTGDLTEKGYYSEYLEVVEYLNLFKSPLFSIPGNHDSRNVGNESFEEIIGERNWARKIDNGEEMLLIGLDSSEPDIDEGHVGRAQQIWMENILDEAVTHSLFSIVAIHHHVIPIPSTGREKSVLSDAGDVLKSLIDNNVDIVMCGHRHVPYLWKFENTLFISAGTTSSTKLRGKSLNSFNTYDITENRVDAILNQIDGAKISLGNLKRAF